MTPRGGQVTQARTVRVRDHQRRDQVVVRAAAVSSRSGQVRAGLSSSLVCAGARSSSSSYLISDDVHVTHDLSSGCVQSTSPSRRSVRDKAENLLFPPLRTPAGDLQVICPRCPLIYPPPPSRVRCVDLAQRIDVWPARPVRRIRERLLDYRAIRRNIRVHPPPPPIPRPFPALAPTGHETPFCGATAGHARR
jgi:hypothetical protein